MKKIRLSEECYNAALLKREEDRYAAIRNRKSKLVDKERTLASRTHIDDLVKNPEISYLAKSQAWLIKSLRSQARKRKEEGYRHDGAAKRIKLQSCLNAAHEQERLECVLGENVQPTAEMCRMGRIIAAYCGVTYHRAQNAIIKLGGPFLSIFKRANELMEEDGYDFETAVNLAGSTEKPANETIGASLKTMVFSDLEPNELQRINDLLYGQRIVPEEREDRDSLAERLHEYS